MYREGGREGEDGGGKVVGGRKGEDGGGVEGGRRARRLVKE